MSTPVRVELGEGGPTPDLALAEVATLCCRVEPVNPDTTFTELGVRSFDKDTFHRRTLTGAEFTWQELYLVRKNDLIFGNLMAWEQAIAISPPEGHGCGDNHRMLSCEANPAVAVRGALWYYFAKQEGFDKIYAASPGTAARNRTTTAPALMSIEVPSPSSAMQQTFDQLQVHVAKLNTEHAAFRQANAALLPATLELIFQTEVAP